MAPNPFICAARTPGFAALPTISALVAIAAALGGVASAMMGL
jgi:hypothetical protein